MYKSSGGNAYFSEMSRAGLSQNGLSCTWHSRDGSLVGMRAVLQFTRVKPLGPIVTVFLMATFETERRSEISYLRFP